MDPNEQIPEYRVLEDSFFEPNYVLKGSVVRGTFSPGPHLQPLNAAAEAKMEEWYRTEMDELDPKTRKPTGKKEYPHEKYRIATYAAGERHDAQIVSGPPKDEPGTLSLPEQFANTRVNTDQRPPPDRTAQYARDAVAPTHSETGAPLPPVADPLPVELPAQPSTPQLGEAGLVTPKEGDGPPVVEVAVSAPPPSAKRIG